MQDLISNVERFRRGDAAAFEALYSAEAERLGRFVRRYFRSQDAAEDVFQETWVRVWTRREQLRDPSRFTSWLYQIARNCAVEEARRRGRKPELSIYGDEDAGRDMMERLPDTRPNPRQEAEQGERRRIVEAEIGRLDEGAREMLALRFGAGLGLREIAEAMGLPLGTVCAKVSRSLKTVQEGLRRKGMTWEG